MRKFVSLLVLVGSLFVVSAVYAESWHTANSVNLSWESVPKIAETDVIKYQIYTKIGLEGEPVKYGEEVNDVNNVVTFSKEGRYYLGVMTIRYPEGETVGIPSIETSWSYDPLVCAEDTFGIVYYESPASIKGIKISK